MRALTYLRSTMSPEDLESADKEKEQIREEMKANLIEELLFMDREDLEEDGFYPDVNIEFILEEKREKYQSMTYSKLLQLYKEHRVDEENI